MRSLLTLDEVRGLVPDPVKFFIEPFIPQDGIVLLYGKYGTYKTPLTFNMAAAIALGKELWGLTVQKGRVLYVEHDTPTNVVLERMQLIAAAYPRPTPADVILDVAYLYPGLDIVRPFEPSDKAAIDLLKETHKRRGYQVVFLDALRGLHSESDIGSEVVGKVYRGLARIFPGATVVLIHHDRKTIVDESDEMKDESFSGSQAWINHATVGVKVHHKSKRDNRIALRQTKSQASAIHPPMLLDLDEDGAIAKPTHVADIAEVDTLIAGLDPKMSKRSLDLAISEHFGISERTARKKRLESAFGQLGK